MTSAVPTLTIYNDIDLDETAVAVSTRPGFVFWVVAVNVSSAVRYLHFYDAAQGDVTVGTTSVLATIPLPAQADSNGGGFVMELHNALPFNTAITVAATTDVDGNSAPGANEVVVTIGYNVL